jgi:hypothetical protein
MRAARNALLWHETDKVGRETGIPKPVNDAVDGAHNAVQLSSPSLAEPVVRDARTTVWLSFTDVPVNDRREHESHAP